MGAQEAMHLVLRALRRDDRDAVLAVAPTYIGFTGAARTLDLPVFPVRDGEGGIDLADLARARDRGLRPRALYVMPDFANPSGRSMEVPAAPDGSVSLLADELAKLKSMVTVNTSAIGQAVIGGRLIEAGYHLRPVNEPQATAYRENLRLMLTGLACRFGDARFAGRVAWNTPEGGFFLVLDVPFLVDNAALQDAAREHGVLFTPMTYFLRGGRSATQMRLSFSRLTPAELETGLDRLAAFVAGRLPQPRS